MRALQVSTGRLLVLILAVLQSGAQPVAATTPGSPSIGADASVHVPAFDVPYTPLASAEAKQQLLDTAVWLEKMQKDPSLNVGTEADRIIAARRYLDDAVFKPGAEQLSRTFAVTITRKSMAGVQTEIITPAKGIASKNAHRVLLNLHGGSFAVGARWSAQMESIPIASMGGITVIAVDYRMWPEFRFPAASEDVASVYGELLKEYRPENIGIYGCSAGGLLTAQSLAWFQKHNLPRPGAAGIFGVGASFTPGDSNFFGSVLAGISPDATEETLGYLDVPGLDHRSALVAPAYSPTALARFPPSLLISGTRDPWMSDVVFTHSRLIAAGVDARLHIWEGAPHCVFAGPIVNPNQPESREAWSVIVKFFDTQLGARPN